MLILPIKRKWYNMILSGEKKEEYREIKPYYTSRFKNYINKNVDIILRNGYSLSSPQIKCKCFLTIGEGKEEWGANPKKQYYILKILNVKEI